MRVIAVIPRVRRWIAAVVVSLAPAGVPAGERPAVVLTLDGAEDTVEPVFLWRRDACQPSQIPDSPARAYRDQRGMVHLFASHYVNWAMVGPTLGEVRVDCRVVLELAEDRTVAQFDDRGWLQAFHTRDGRTVQALVSHDYHGARHGTCALPPPHTPGQCWYGAITAAVSTDGGYRFTLRPPAERVVAAVDQPYDPTTPRPIGIFTVSNLVDWGGLTYALVFAEATGDQPRGNCLIRSADPADPGGWRAWNGVDFVGRFRNPYSTRPPGALQGAVCTPVGRGVLNWPVRSLGWYAPAQVFVAILFAALPDPATRRPIPGVYYATSPDLRHWSRASLVRAVPGRLDRTACAPYFRYPSLLDPTSPARLFDTIGDRAFLYLTRFNPDRCRQTLDRDLVRQPVRIAPAKR